MPEKHHGALGVALSKAYHCAKAKTETDSEELLPTVLTQISNLTASGAAKWRHRMARLNIPALAKVC
ncbi:MAG: hypothetical protein AB8B63_06060 [Granulosicoccus sp.]